MSIVALLGAAAPSLIRAQIIIAPEHFVAGQGPFFAPTVSPPLPIFAKTPEIRPASVAAAAPNPLNTPFPVAPARPAPDALGTEAWTAGNRSTSISGTVPPKVKLLTEASGASTDPKAGATTLASVFNDLLTSSDDSSTSPALSFDPVSSLPALPQRRGTP